MFEPWIPCELVFSTDNGRNGMSDYWAVRDIFNSRDEHLCKLAAVNCVDKFILSMVYKCKEWK